MGIASSNAFGKRGRGKCIFVCIAGLLCLLLPLCAGYQSGAQTIVFSEIMYNPPDAPDPLGGSNTVAGGDLEFIELLNAGASPYDLKGAYFSDGIAYAFADSYVLNAGERVVVIRDIGAFTGRYGVVSGTAPGNFTGQLANGGETVELSDSNDVSLFSVKYSDAGEWSKRADGNGSSLVLSNLGGDPDDPANWCSSDRLYGAPGETDAYWAADIVINELLAHTDYPQEDAVEFKNLSAGSIDLTGWYLSDSIVYPRKYRITNITVSAGSYGVLYEYQFNTNQFFDSNNTAFALSSFGDDTYLTAPLTSTNDLRLVDFISFEATENGVSLGRHPDGTGDFFPLESLTFGTTNPSDVETFRTGTGASNSAPRPGVVVINEIMYHPVQSNEQVYEYVELYNSSYSNMDLSGWIIDGVGFTNPPGTVVGPTSYLVICASSSAITNLYGITNVIGDWPGLLKNGGETITLRNPDGVPMDAVDYDDKPPWPTGADGNGPSIERVKATSSGLLSANWMASRAETNWQTLVWTQQAVSGSADVRLWVDFEGMCWVDDVSVRKNGSGPNLVSNGGFEAGMTGWSAISNHAQSRVESGAGIGGGAALAVNGNLTRILDFINGSLPVLYYGDAYTNRVVSSSFSINSGSDYVVRLSYQRRGAGENLHVRFDGSEQAVFLGHRGSPGTANDLSANALPLGITDVWHDSNRIGAGTANVIRAEFNDPSAISTCRLRYRTVSTGDYEFTDADYVSLAMTNAGGGIFSVAMPAFSTNWTLVRYHVSATATNGYEVRSPRLDDSSRDYGYWVEADPVQTKLPNWHLLIDGNDVVYPIAQRATAISPEGQVFPDVQVRHRGRDVTGVGRTRTGVALRMFDDRLYDSWFGKSQDGTNFRNRKNDLLDNYRRVLNEHISYGLQRTMGLPTPFVRHVCLWIDGGATITEELERPTGGFLANHGMDSGDYISRAGYTGRNMVDGDETLDNFSGMNYLMETATGAAMVEAVRTNIWYEPVRHSMALVSMIADGDQFFSWNMFQHRRASDGRWAQYPWDVDLSFSTGTITETGTYLPHLHPYYESPAHGSIWDTNFARPMGRTFFYQETGPGSEYTLPFRHRHQMTLWRYCHTMFTTNYLYPVIDDLVSNLSPAYLEIGWTPIWLNTAATNMKNFVNERRDFYMNGSWSDKDTNIWNIANIYEPTNIVLTEIMYDPDKGSEYLEFYNTWTQTIDMSWWKLQAGGESYHLPHGTMLPPTSYLVIADSQWELTNDFSELSDGSEMIVRYLGMPIWDRPIVFLTNSEYATRVVEIPDLTLPNVGANIRLYDLRSNLIDQVTYGISAPWPAAKGSSLELVHAADDNSSASSWRRSFFIGTPGSGNTASNDLDGDGLIDIWEQTIVDDAPGVPTNIFEVLPGGDYDMDGLPNGDEFVLGTDPTVDDGTNALIHIAGSNGDLLVEFDTFTVSGAGYDYYSNRYYTLEESAQLVTGTPWGVVGALSKVVGTGDRIVYTNSAADNAGMYRFDVDLPPGR
ncbi:MAG: lamin tail domain-containing protein [Verrucomicrobia bacterium]|nr:lamin tail domain-containing protein [Verrucomicrobiota bacterium]